MTTMLSRRDVCGALLGAGLLASGPARAQTPVPNEILFRNVHVFNGRASQLSGATDVWVRGNTIAAVGTGGGAASATVIEGAGRTLMPGLIDAHWHMFLAATPIQMVTVADPSYLHLLAAREAGATLMRGFTTIRDLGGPMIGIKRAIDEGVFPGPRIYPCGAMISQTSGHGDARFLHEIPRIPGGPLSHSEAIGLSAIADTPDEIRIRAREQLRLGATQIKLMAGGGVNSPPHNPIESTQYTEEEIRAAVEAAENWGTYVAVHAYHPRSIQMAIRAGVKCIDHGHLADETTARMMAERGIWWSLQPLNFQVTEEWLARADPPTARRARQVIAGTDTSYNLAKAHKIKTAFGADIVGDANAVGRQGTFLAQMTRWYTPAEVLRMATADNGELMALCGFINPYPGTLGVVEEGALADLILVNGNPLENLELVADPVSNFVVIMKDGVIHKNSLTG